MKTFYDLWYRFGTPPWVGPARSELVKLVESGDLLPGRAIDLGCASGSRSVCCRGCARCRAHGHPVGFRRGGGSPY